MSEAMSTISEAFDAIAQRKAEYRQARADLTALHQEHSRTRKRLEALRAEFATVATNAAKAEKIAARIGAAERLEAEQARLMLEREARVKAADRQVQAAERDLSRLRQRRRDVAERLHRAQGERARLARQAEEAQRAADRQRDLLAQHDAVLRRLEAELADLAEPEAA